MEEACRSNPRSTVENINSTQRDANRIVISDSRVSPVAERIRVLNDIWRSLLLVLRFDEHTEITTRIPETCHETLTFSAFTRAQRGKMCLPYPVYMF